MPPMAAADVRARAVLQADDGVEAAPAALIDSMIWFESRYGGLWYPVIGPNDMEYGLDGVPAGHRGPLGLAFRGILDGDWTTAPSPAPRHATSPPWPASDVSRIRYPRPPGRPSNGGSIRSPGSLSRPS
jgi:hypothetical protein